MTRSAFPSNLSVDDGFRPTGVSCPSCGGVLEVRLLGRGHLEVRCPVGHVFSRDELLAAQEDRVEEALWKAAVSIEELDAILASYEANDANTDPSRERRRRLAAMRRDIARLLENDERMDLAPLPGGGPHGVR